MPIPLTAAISQNQRRAMHDSKVMQQEANAGATTLKTQDVDGTGGKTELIYIYNILELPHLIEQPPLFPHLDIPPCEKGQKFAFTVIPRFVKLPFVSPGTTEVRYDIEDGRRSANQIMNPASYPGVDWNSQMHKWESMDQTGNNLNAFGCFWSLTHPDDETGQLDKEIAIFKERWLKVTCKELISQGETLNASGKRDKISMLMHFAMDYTGKQAPWHMASEHQVSCPNCGMLIKEGIAYHRNEFGERCIVDRAKCIELGLVPKDEPDLEAETESVGATAGAPKAATAKGKKKTA